LLPREDIDSDAENKILEHLYKNPTDHHKVWKELLQNLFFQLATYGLTDIEELFDIHGMDDDDTKELINSQLPITQVEQIISLITDEIITIEQLDDLLFSHYQELNGDEAKQYSFRFHIKRIFPFGSFIDLRTILVENTTEDTTEEPIEDTTEEPVEDTIGGSN
jgi:hypothetical protein